jgi:Flp pilus assembly protein CpaB
MITVKVARSALQISLALRERAGVRETAMAAATHIVRGGADAMAVTKKNFVLPASFVA